MLCKYNDLDYNFISDSNKSLKIFAKFKSIEFHLSETTDFILSKKQSKY